MSISQIQAAAAAIALWRARETGQQFPETWARTHWADFITPAKAALRAAETCEIEDGPRPAKLPRAEVKYDQSYRQRSK